MGNCADRRDDREELEDWALYISPTVVAVQSAYASTFTFSATTRKCN